MAQFGLPTINPAVKDGEGLAYDLNSWALALHSGHSGTTRPSYITAGGAWIDTSSVPWKDTLFDGTDNIIRGTIDPVTNTYTASGGGGGGSVPGQVSDISFSYTYGLGNMVAPQLLKITGGIAAVNNTAMAGASSRHEGVFVRDVRASTEQGTLGNVNAGLFVHTVTRNGNQNSFEWNGLFITDVISSGPGEHVGMYSQCNVYGTAAGWGACLQVDDMRYDQTDAGLLWGLEVDCFISGGGKSNSSGIVVVANDSKKVFTNVSSSTRSVVQYGLRFGVENNALFDKCIQATGFKDTGALVYDYDNSAVSALRIQGAYTNSAIQARFTTAPVGIDLTDNNTFSSAAIALSATHKIKFGVNELYADGTTLTWNGVAVGGGGGSGSSTITVGSIPQFSSEEADIDRPMLIVPENKRLIFKKIATTADYASIDFKKDLSVATGGLNQSGSNVRIDTTTGASYYGSECGLLVSFTNNSVNNGGTNYPFAARFEATKTSTASMSGVYTIVTDTTNTNNPPTAQTGQWINLTSGGTDDYGARSCLILSASKNSTAASTFVGNGVYVAGSSSAWFDKGAYIKTPIKSAGLYFETSAASGATDSAVIRSVGASHKGIDLKASAHSTSIAMDIAVNDTYCVNSVPVLKRQAGGWTKVIGTIGSNRNYYGGDFNLNNVNTSFVLATTTDLQGHVIALYKQFFTLINDLRFHGVIGGNPNSTANASFQAPPT